MRLVDADAEVERLMKDYCEECTRKECYGIFGAACTPCWVKDAVEEFENAQTIELEERHGYWIIRGGDMWCSECGYGDVTEFGEPEDYHYCPNCGCCMKEDINDG